MGERLRRGLRRHGFSGLLKLVPKNAWFVLSYLAPHRRRLRRSINEFDQRFGVDTGGFEWLSNFDAPSDFTTHANNYGPIHKIDPYLKSLHICFPEYTFIDYGCGKGRALLLASDFPFKEIIGVEYVEELVAITRRNLEIYHNCAQKCHAIGVVKSDARSFKPPAAPSVFFFYNPFDAIVLERVLSLIRGVHSGKEFVNYIVYCDPEHRLVIEGDEGWEILAEHETWVLYRSCFGAGRDGHRRRSNREPLTQALFALMGG